MYEVEGDIVSSKRDCVSYPKCKTLYKVVDKENLIFDVVVGEGAAYWSNDLKAGDNIKAFSGENKFCVNGSCYVHSLVFEYFLLLLGCFGVFSSFVYKKDIYKVEVKAD